MANQRWRYRAACADADPELFTADVRGRLDAAGNLVNQRTERAQRVRQARAICAVCPVRLDCLNEAVDTGSVGIWGGEILRTHPRADGYIHPIDLARALRRLRQWRAEQVA